MGASALPAGARCTATASPCRTWAACTAWRCSRRRGPLAPAPLPRRGWRLSAPPSSAALISGQPTLCVLKARWRLAHTDSGGRRNDRSLLVLCLRDMVAQGQSACLMPAAGLFRKSLMRTCKERPNVCAFAHYDFVPYAEIMEGLRSAWFCIQARRSSRAQNNCSCAAVRSGPHVGQSVLDAAGCRPIQKADRLQAFRPVA